MPGSGNQVLRLSTLMVTLAVYQSPWRSYERAERWTVGGGGGGGGGPVGATVALASHPPTNSLGMSLL